MVYTKRTKKVFMGFKGKKKVHRRQYASPNRPISMGYTHIHNFKRVYSSGLLSTTANVDFYSGQVFLVTAIPNYAEFSALYHNIRINSVSWQLIPAFTGNEMTNTYNNAANWALAPIYTYIDHNDSTFPSSESEFLQSASLKITRGNGIHMRSFTPSILAQNYEGVGATSYTPKYRQWLTTQNAGDLGTPHYGLKLFIPKMGSTMYIQFRIFVTYYFSCKDLR